MMVIFGILCLFTSGWWAVYMLKAPESDNMFWLATIFLFLFGTYQVYAGLGYAKRYISFKDDLCTVRQNSFLPAKSFTSDQVIKIEIGTSDISVHFKDGKKFNIKLGLKYPDLGENIKDHLTEYASDHNIELFYKNRPL